MTTEGSPGLGPEQQVAISSTLARISSLHQAPNLEAGELLGQFEQLDLLGVTSHPAIAAALRAEGKIPEVADRVKSNLEIARSTGSRQEIEKFQRLGVLLGVEEPPVAVPEAEDGEMARLQGEVLAAVRELAEKKGVPPDDIIRAHLPSEVRVQTEDLSMLSLSQLKERAASLTPQQLSQIPLYKLYIMIDDELLTVRQITGLPEDPRAKAINNQLIQSNLNFDGMYDLLRMSLLRKEDGSLVDIKDLPKMAVEAARETFQALMQVNPRLSSQRIAAYSLDRGLESLEQQWQRYLKYTSRPVVGGLARITARKPALNQKEISRLRNLNKVVAAALLVYSEATHSEWLSEEENYLAETGSLKKATIELYMPDLENNLAKDPDSFPLLAKYVRELKEAETAKPPETAEQTARAQELFGRLRSAYREKPLETTVEAEKRTDELQTQIGKVLGLGEDETTETIVKEEERGVLLGFRYKENTILEAILKSEQPSSPQTLFPQSKELQQAFVELQQAYQAFRDDSIVNKYKYDASIRAFFTTLDGAIGIDQDENSRLYGDADNAVFSFKSLLKGISEDSIPGAQISDLSRAFAEKNRKMIASQRATNSWAQQELELLLGAAQRAGLELNRVINLEPLLRAGVVLPT